MLHLDSPAVRDALWSARFGLEREALRVTRDRRMSRTPHPFPQDDPRIVRDFCENQTEINTGVSESAAAAVAELERIDARLRAAHPAREQIAAVRNAKAAARYDLGTATILAPDGSAAPVRDAALCALDDLDAFCAPLGAPPAVREALAFQREKLERPGARYAERVLAGVGGAARV